jgi:hypothetical protein
VASRYEDVDDEDVDGAEISSFPIALNHNPIIPIVAHEL